MVTWQTIAGQAFKMWVFVFITAFPWSYSFWYRGVTWPWKGHGHCQAGSPYRCAYIMLFSWLLQLLRLLCSTLYTNKRTIDWLADHWGPVALGPSIAACIWVAEACIMHCSHPDTARHVWWVCCWNWCIWLLYWWGLATRLGSWFIVCCLFQ